MPTYDLTNQYISSSFQQLTQISGSVLVDGTGSAINNLTVTASKAISSSYADTASVLLGTITSASHAVTADTASVVLGTITSASHAVTADTASFVQNAQNATSASHAVQADTASTSISASHAINSDSSISSSYANNASTADSATEIFVSAKNVQGVSIPKGYAVHSSGVTGENINITTASYEDGTLMPAIGITQTAINASATGQVIISGRLQGVNTSNLIAGSPVYVNGNGTLTATKPTGSALIQNIGTAVKIDATDGEIIVMGAGRANDLPNIAEGYAWVGNSNGVPVAVTTSSIGNQWDGQFSGSAGITGSLEFQHPTIGAFTGPVILPTGLSHPNVASGGFAGMYNVQKINDVSGSGFTFGDSSVELNVKNTNGAIDFQVHGTSSLGIGRQIGNQRLRVVTDLNTDLDITDGSVTGSIFSGSQFIGPLTGTASIASDLVSNARINITDITASNASFTSASIGYLQSITGSAKVIGDAFLILNNDTPAERYAGIKVLDTGSTTDTASLLWDGQTNDWFYEFSSSATHEYGVVMMGPQYSTLGSPTYPSANTILKGNNNHHITDSNLLDDGSKISSTLPFSSSAGFTGSLNGNADTSTTASFSSTASYVNPLSQDVSITGKFTDTVTATIGSTEEVKNFTYPGFTKTLSPGNGKTYNLNYQGYANFAGFGLGTYENVYLTNQYDSVSYNFGAESLVGGARTHLVLVGSGSTAQAQRDSAFILTDGGDSNAIMRIYASEGLIGDRSMDNLLIGNSYNGSLSGRRTQEVSISSEDITIGSAQGWTHNRLGSTVSFSSSTPTKDINFFYTGSMILRQTGSLVAPAIVISGSAQGTVDALSIASNTASLDCRQSDFFTLTLVSGSDTFLNVNNVQSGQSFQVKVAQPTTAADSHGTLSYSTNVKFAGGTAPTITAVSGSEDILTFTAFDSTNVYGTAVQNLS